MHDRQALYQLSYNPHSFCILGISISTQVEESKDPCGESLLLSDSKSFYSQLPLNMSEKYNARELDTNV